jgi:hypothetical protein
MAVPTPTEVSPWYLRNINQALALDETSGEVYVRTGITGDVIITGPVTIPGTVTVNSSPEDPVHVHLDEVGTSGILTTPNLPISIQDAAGNENDLTHPVYVNVTNLPATQPVSGTVNVGNFPATQPVSGTVNIGTIPEVEVKNDSGNPLAVSGTVTANQGTSPWVVSGNITVQGTTEIGFPSNSTDAFGRLRVSEPYTLFDTNNRYYDHNQFSTATSGTANVAYVSNQSSFQLTVGSANGDSVIRETMKVFPYQPGKSQLTLLTTCMNTPKTNLRQRVGLFGANDGVFFENDGTYNYMVIRSGSTGVEERVRQDAWNGDRLNGAGGANNPSGITLYPDRTQIYYADVEWLGVGTVRVGFIINGVYITCHSFNHANQTGNTKVYMTTATLPIRYEITNTGATSGASMMTQICSTVISEGGYNNFGTTQTAGTGTTQKRLATAGTYYPVVSIRLAPTRLDSIVFPRQVDVLSPSVNYYRWTLLQNPTLTGATWTGTSPTGTVQYDLGATTVSGGIEIQTGYASARELTQLSAIDFFQFQLGRTLAGVSDVITLALAATSPNADVLAELGWQELT